MNRVTLCLFLCAFATLLISTVATAQPVFLPQIGSMPDYNQPNAEIVNVGDVPPNPSWPNWCAPTSAANVWSCYDAVSGTNLAPWSGSLPQPQPYAWSASWSTATIQGQGVDPLTATPPMHMNTNGVVFGTYIIDIYAGLQSYASTVESASGISKGAYTFPLIVDEVAAGPSTVPPNPPFVNVATEAVQFLNYQAAILAGTPTILCFDAWVKNPDTLLGMDGDVEYYNYDATVPGYGSDGPFDERWEIGHGHAVTGVGYNLNFDPDGPGPAPTADWYIVRDNWTSTGVNVAVPTAGFWNATFYIGEPTEGPCVDDGYEDNDDCGSAAVLTPAGAPYGGLTVCPGDDDYYSVSMLAGETLTVDVLFAHADGDLNVELLSPDCGTILDSGTSTTDNEQVSYDIDADGDYRIRVYGASEIEENIYDLDFAITQTEEGYLILFSVEGPLDGSPQPTAPLDENHIYVHVPGSPYVVMGGLHDDLLMGFSPLDPPPFGLDGFDVIEVGDLGQGNQIVSCYWSSEIDFLFDGTMMTPPSPLLIQHGDIIAKNIMGPGYFIRNQILRMPFDFWDAAGADPLDPGEDIGLDALDIEGIDGALYFTLSEGVAGPDQALGSIYLPEPMNQWDDDATEEFSVLGSRKFWVFWSFETMDEPLTLGPTHNILNPYNNVLLPPGTQLSADDLLCTVFDQNGPTVGYLVKTGRDDFPAVTPDIESLFENTGHQGETLNVGLDAVDMPEAVHDLLADPAGMPYGSDEFGEVGPVTHPDVINKILFSTSQDNPASGAIFPDFGHGDVLETLLASGNPGPGNDLFQGILFSTLHGHLEDNEALTNTPADLDDGLDGLDVIPDMALEEALSVADWAIY